MTDDKQLNNTEPSATPWKPWWKKGVIDLWDKRVLIPAFIVGLAVYVWCSYQIKIHTPPEGYVFEQLEPLTGIYKCCEDGPRYSKSWVGDVNVSCAVPTYYGGQSLTACRFKDELEGKVVTVVRIKFPHSWGVGIVTKEIFFGSHIYYAKTDDQIRRQWISASEGGAQSNALGAFLIVYLITFFIYDRKLKNQGGKK